MLGLGAHTQIADVRTGLSWSPDRGVPVEFIGGVWIRGSAPVRLPEGGAGRSRRFRERGSVVRLGSVRWPVRRARPHHSRHYREPRRRRTTATANPSAFEAWNGDSGLRWVASADRRDRVLAPAADALLAAGSLSLGDRVLDIDCGRGVTTLLTAGAVGIAGTVIGVDISAPMLDLASQLAREAAITNATFVHGDAQTHNFEPVSVDVVISRFGTMFFADPAAAFTNIATAVWPAGRLRLATWQPLVANELLMVPGVALLNHTDLPADAPDESGMFAQSDPDRVTATLDSVGFTNIGLDATEVTFTLGQTLDEAVDYLADSGLGRALLEAIPEGAARDAAVANVRDVLADHEFDSGVELGDAIRSSLDQV